MSYNFKFSEVYSNQINFLNVLDMRGHVYKNDCDEINLRLEQLSKKWNFSFKTDFDTKTGKMIAHLSRNVFTHDSDENLTTQFENEVQENNV